MKLIKLVLLASSSRLATGAVLQHGEPSAKDTSSRTNSITNGSYIEYSRGIDYGNSDPVVPYLPGKPPFARKDYCAMAMPTTDPCFAPANLRKKVLDALTQTMSSWHNFSKWHHFYKIDRDFAYQMSARPVNGTSKWVNITMSHNYGQYSWHCLHYCMQCIGTGLNSRAAWARCQLPHLKNENWPETEFMPCFVSYGSRPGNPDYEETYEMESGEALQADKCDTYQETSEKTHQSDWKWGSLQFGELVKAEWIKKGSNIWREPVKCRMGGTLIDCRFGGVGKENTGDMRKHDQDRNEHNGKPV
jgi:hypothetical protein